MKRNTLTMLMLLLFSVTFTGLQKARAQATVTNVQFVQYDRYSATGTLLFANSSLGSVLFSPVTHPFQRSYLNIYAKNVSGSDVWIVKNYPLPANQVMDCQAVSIDYKLLGYTPGAVVSSVQYNYSITPTLAIAVNTDTAIYTDDRDTIRNTGDHIRSGTVTITDNNPGPIPGPGTSTAIVTKATLASEISGDYSEYLNTAIFTNTEPAVDTPVHHNVPPVEEGPNDCLPGAFARSIGWLTGKDSAGTKPIFDTLKKYMDTCKAPGIEACRVKTKSEILKKMNGGVTTITVINPHPLPTPNFPPAGVPSEPKPADPGGWMKDKLKNCDVEMMYFDPVSKVSHAVTVTRVDCDGKGCCTIWFRDDEDQTKKGGDKCEKSVKVCGDSLERDGKKKKLWYLVAECPATTRMATTQQQPVVSSSNVILEQNKPNPFGAETTISIKVADNAAFKNAFLVVRDMYSQEVYRSRLSLQKGNNNITYRPSSRLKGILYYSLELDGKTIDTKQMIFQNY